MGNETFQDGGYLSEESNLINIEMEEFLDLNNFGWDMKKELSFDAESSPQISYDSLLPPIQTVLPTHFPNSVNYSSNSFDQLIRSSPTSLHISAQVKFVQFFPGVQFLLCKITTIWIQFQESANNGNFGHLQCKSVINEAIENSEVIYGNNQVLAYKNIFHRLSIFPKHDNF